jgi:hypothetical protein
MNSSIQHKRNIGKEHHSFLRRAAQAKLFAGVNITKTFDVLALSCYSYISVL